MNVLLFLALIITEIWFAWFSFQGRLQKTIFFRNKLLLNLAETIFVLGYRLFGGYSAGLKYTVLLVICFIRLIVVGIIFLCTRKSQKEKSRAGVLVGTVLSINFMVLCGIPAILFTNYDGLETSGPYEVATAETILVDKGRVEEFEYDGSYREIPIHIYYPADAEQGKKFPTVLFSHGAFGFYMSNYSTYAELASNGYVVVSLDHPYHSFFCTDSDGKIITVNPQFYAEAMYVNSDKATEGEIDTLAAKWLTIRTSDMAFAVEALKEYNLEQELSEAWIVKGDSSGLTAALNYMDIQKIALMGHSLGGAAAVSLGRIRDDVTAVVDIDGTMLDQKSMEPYPIPILNIDNEEHHFSRLEAKQTGVVYENNLVMDYALEGYDTYFANAGHMNLTDLPMFSPILANAYGTGTIDSKACITELNALILDFCNSTLKQMGTFEVKECYGDTDTAD